jgi:Fe-S-cluster containining protein
MMICENCGVCCTQILFHASGKIDMAWLAARKGRLVGQAILFPNVCENYDEKTKRCKIYENRPLSCRAFKVYSRECLLCRESAGI